MSINVNDKNLGHATAYAYYKAGGGTMTEAEFTEFMADFGTASQTAVEAAQAALASKNAAQTAATTATNKASEATTAATTATNKAAEAQADADAAALDASQAMSAASTATTKATEATTAAATATSAKTDAVAANTAAQSAKTAAQTAQTGAETAAASVQSSAAQIQTNADDISELKEDFTQMESDGVVPSAEQIISDKGITDSVPYHYRRTGGNGADRLYDQIVGGTVNFNQQIENGNFGNGSTGWGITNTSTQINSVESGVLSMTCSVANSGISTNTSYLKNHKYLKTVDVKSTAIVRYDVDGAFVKMSSGSGNWETLASVFDFSYNSNTFRLYIRLTSNATVFGEVQVRNAMLIDLTAMFGTEIADYIYSLETAHAGDGVAFFKSLFPNDYYPYNAGTLKSVEGLSAHKMVGFNQWDEESEDGTWNNTTGAPVEAIASRRNKNPISVVPNTSYYTNKVLYRYFYDSDMTFLSYDPSGTNQFTTPANARYMNIKQGKADWDGTNTNINLSDPAKNGTYEPYKAHSYSLDSTLTLRGLFKLDANNNLYYDGDEYVSDGTVTRQYREVVFNGTENWGIESSSWNSHGLNAFYIVLGAGNQAYFTSASDMPMLICDKFVGASNTSLKASDKTGLIGFVGGNGSANYIEILSDATDVASFKTWLANNNTKVVYKLITPTTESADPYQHLQQCDPSGTEEYVSTGIVPIGHNSFYPENLRAKVEGLPWNFASLIAPTESAFVATRNYTTGSLFIVDNVLYKATANIANGGTITPNTNCTATTLAEIISALA